MAILMIRNLSAAESVELLETTPALLAIKFTKFMTPLFHWAIRAIVAAFFFSIRATAEIASFKFLVWTAQVII